MEASGTPTAGALRSAAFAPVSHRSGAPLPAAERLPLSPRTRPARRATPPPSGGLLAACTAAEPLTQAQGVVLTARRERDIRPAHVLTGERPCRLTIPCQGDFRQRCMPNSSFDASILDCGGWPPHLHLRGMGRPPTVRPTCPAAWRAGIDGSSRILAPLPVTDLRHVLTMPGDVVPVGNELVAHRLLDVCRPTPHVRQAVDGVPDQIEAVHVVHDRHVERRRDGPLKAREVHLPLCRSKD